MKLFNSRRAANSANAQKSTGPRTDEGKAKSSQNARKHGLTSAKPSVPDDLRPRFEEMVEDYMNEIAPVGTVEETLMGQFITAAWNL